MTPCQISAILRAMRFLALLLLGTSSFAQSHDPFSYGQGQAVFVDFVQATYDITYDVNQKRVSATASIRFRTDTAGYPIFDSLVEPQQLILDGSPVTQTLTLTPNQETRVRVIDQPIGRGDHQLQIMLPITQNVSFTASGVDSGFWDTDLTDRSYLEKYLPANLIHDQVQMTFQIHFIGATGQSLYTNGDVTRIDDSNYLVQYPEKFTANSIFFHTLPTQTVEEIRFTFPSIDGRSVPGVIYRTKPAPANEPSLAVLKDRLVGNLNSLEQNFGAYLHPMIIGFMVKSGGMEYNGGFTFSQWAINHELSHAYFGRGLIPADGNAGWIDEALAVWWTNGMPNKESPPLASSMANHPPYTRITDGKAYSLGADFMAYLNFILQPKGGLKPFLVDYLANHAFQPYTTPEFAQAMSDYYQMDFVSLFKDTVAASVPPAH